MDDLPPIHERDFNSVEIVADLKTLGGHLTQIFDDHLGSSSHLHVTNLACGRADETHLLSTLLTERVESASIHGRDIREREIVGAVQRWKHPLETQHRNLEIDFRLQRGDRPNQSSEPHSDLIFIRHQNYWFDPSAWTRLYDQALHQLETKGIIVITSYFDREHAMARQILTNLGAIEVQHIRNEHSRLIIENQDTVKSIDRHISVFKRAT